LGGCGNCFKVANGWLAMGRRKLLEQTSQVKYMHQVEGLGIAMCMWVYVILQDDLMLRFNNRYDRRPIEPVLTGIDQAIFRECVSCVRGQYLSYPTIEGQHSR